MKLSFILLLVFPIMLSSCIKGRLNCKQNFYAFKMNTQVFPNKDTIAVGETLWVEINEPVILEDIQQRQKVDYSGAVNLGTNIGFQEIIGTVPQLNNVANDFIYTLIKGIETANTNPTLFREFVFTESNGNYVFKLGIIPKRTGVFRFTMGNAAGVYRKADKCTKASFEFNIANNQHFYLYPGGANTPPGGPTYYFAVK